MERVLDIAIVGCGIGALASASMLRDLGHKVTIYDQSDTPRPEGAGLVIQPVSLPVLSQLGVLGPALSCGVKLRAVQGIDHVTGRTALFARYDAVDRDQYALALHRETLFDLLLRAAQSRQVRIKPDHLVFGINDPEAPYLRIEGNRQAGPFDMVIDASGARSLCSPLMTQDMAYGMLWGLVDLPDGAHALGERMVQRYLGTRKLAAVLPIGTLPGETGQKACVFWSLRCDEYDDWREADLADWASEAHALWPDFGVLVEQFRSHDALTFQSFGHGALGKLVDGRIAFIGDAAHRSAPHIAQGANMALLDAMALAEAVAEAKVPAALRRFARRRGRHIRAYQALSRVGTPLLQSDAPAFAGLRERVLLPLSRTQAGARLISRILSGQIVDPFGSRRRRRSSRLPVGGVLRGPGE